MKINGTAARRRVARGFTQIELMTRVAVMATVMAMAVPALGDVVRNGRRTATVNELLTGLMLARSEAIKRGQPTVVCGVRDSNGNGTIDEAERVCTGRDWSAGWIVAVWRDANGDHRVDPGELDPVLHHHAVAGSGLTVTVPTLSNFPSVAPAGTVVMKPFNQRPSNGTLVVCDARGPEQARALVLSGTGRARVIRRKSDGGPLNCL